MHPHAIEGIESESGWWAAGIQWHAELLGDRTAVRLFEGLISTAGTKVSR